MWIQSLRLFALKNQIKVQINTWGLNHPILKDIISNFSSTRSRTFLLLRCSRPIDVRSLLLTFYCFYSLYTICLSIFLFHWRCQTLLLTLAFDGTACCHFERGESEDCLFPPPLRDITPISPWGPLQIVTEITFCLLPNVFTENVKWFSHRYSFRFPLNFYQ